MVSDRVLEKLQWWLLAIFLFLDLISFTLNRLYWIWNQSALYYLIPDIFLLAFLILNAWQWLRPKGMVVLFLWSALLAWAAESYAISYQPFGSYEFRLSSEFSIGLIPFFVLLSWPFFIFVGLQVSNSLFLWHGKSLPNKHNGAWKNILVLSFLDAYLVTAVDLIIDPIQKYEKLWIWKDGGIFYDVPLGNFLGWFMVTGVSTLVYRIFQYFNDKKRVDVQNLSSTLLIPVLIYVIIALFYVYSAYRLEDWDLAGIGAMAMLPIPLWSLWIYIRKRNKN